MNRIAAFVVEHGRLAWGVFLLVAAAIAVVAGYQHRAQSEDERLSLLETDADRQGIEIMSLTLNGNLMGSVALLGMIDTGVKRDALAPAAARTPGVVEVLENISHAYDAQGSFVVGNDGVVHASWDSSGKPSTGLDVRFRPYYRMAMLGKENVYAAVSLARGDRALYFSAPVFAGTGRTTPSIGAIVARTDVAKVDKLLKGKADIALLLSPQGVVFASSEPGWLGFLAGAPSVERLRAIRELKQFGNLFENRDPSLLPVPFENGIHRLAQQRYAVATAPVQWNDPSGDWKVVLLENLSRTIPAGEPVRIGGIAGGLALVMGLMILNILRRHHAQIVSGQKLEAYAKAQAASAERKSRLSAVALRLQQSENLSDLARDFLAETHLVLGVLRGVVYVATDSDSGKLQLAASYACDPDIPVELLTGEGLLGQCAIERQARVIETSSSGFRPIHSGLGEAAPAAIFMAPIVLRDTLLGVLELATLTVPGNTEREQFDQMVALLAMNLEVLRRNRWAREERSQEQPT